MNREKPNLSNSEYALAIRVLGTYHFCDYGQYSNVADRNEKIIHMIDTLEGYAPLFGDRAYIDLEDCCVDFLLGDVPMHVAE